MRLAERTAHRLVTIALFSTFIRCSSDPSGNDARGQGANAGTSGSGAQGNGGTAGASGGQMSSAGGAGAVSAGGSPSTGGRLGGAGAPDSGGATVDASRPPGPPPKMGAPGCGFDAAAFCDTFDGSGAAKGRAGELDARFWSGSRMHGQLSTTRAMGVGMALIPACRA